MDFGELPLDDGELLPFDALKDEQPDSQRVTEATGNEGASYERSYHRASFVLWPEAGFADVLLEAGAPAALPYLEKKIDLWLRETSGTRRGKEWTEINQLAKRILKKWRCDPARTMDSRPEHRRALLDLLVQTGSPVLVETAVNQVTTRFFDGEESGELIRATAVLGPAKTVAQMKTVLQRRLPEYPSACLDWLDSLTGEVSTPAWKKTLRYLGETATALLGNTKLPAAKRSYYSSYRGAIVQPVAEPHPVDPEFVERLIAVLEKCGSPQLIAPAIEKLIGTPKVFPPDTVLQNSVIY